MNMAFRSSNPSPWCTMSLWNYIKKIKHTYAPIKNPVTDEMPGTFTWKTLRNESSLIYRVVMGRTNRWNHAIRVICNEGCFSLRWVTGCCPNRAELLQLVSMQSMWCDRVCEHIWNAFVCMSMFVCCIHAVPMPMNYISIFKCWPPVAKL